MLAFADPSSHHGRCAKGEDWWHARCDRSDADDKRTVEDYEATLRQWWERVVAHIGLHGASTDLETAERIREVRAPEPFWLLHPPTGSERACGRGRAGGQEYHARVFVHYATWQLRRLAALVRAPANAVESDAEAPDFARIGAAAQTAVLSLRMACCCTCSRIPLPERKEEGCC